jgi:acetyl esterase/lipase
LERQAPNFDKRIEYGSDPQHFAELRFPDGLGPFPLLFVIHGGFWQSTYDLKHIGSLCAALTKKGIITCNLEYRRIGDSGGGWPGTFLDVSLAADVILKAISSDSSVDASRVAVIGHSAGGHLALWLASRHRIAKASSLQSVHEHRIARAVSLAGVCDLRTAWNQRLGNGAIERLMGGAPDHYPDRFNAGSPIELLPSGSRQVLIHGTDDNIVPISQSEKFVEKAQQLGDQSTLVRLEGVGHFELIDPESDAWSKVAGAVLSLLSLR